LFFDRMVGPLFGALEVLFFFLFAMRLGYGLRRSLLLTLILGFATSLWPDEQSVLEHGEVGFFLLVGFYFAFRYREHGKPRRYLIWSGIGLGGAAITRYQDAFIGLGAVSLYLLLRGGPDAGMRDRLRSFGFLAAGLSPFLVTDAWYNWVRFGRVLATGHHETLLGYPIWQGAAGLLISPGKGFLWYCPTVFLLVLAGGRFSRRFGALSLSWVAMTVVFVAFYGYVTFWHGDPAWGPRYLFSIVPFLTLPLGELLRWQGNRRRVIYGATTAVVMASVLIQFSAVSVSPWRTWYRVIAYEEQSGYTWQWISARYRYFWNVNESPLDYQLHGLYQMAYDTLGGTNRYEIVPPDEDAILDGILNQYDINSWNFWWASKELNWWMGDQKVALALLALIAAMAASGVYLIAEAGGVFAEPSASKRLERLPEAA
jgi:hypothetical protein